MRSPSSTVPPNVVGREGLRRDSARVGRAALRAPLRRGDRDGRTGPRRSEGKGHELPGERRGRVVRRCGPGAGRRRGGRRRDAQSGPCRPPGQVPPGRSRRRARGGGPLGLANPATDREVGGAAPAVGVRRGPRRRERAGPSIGRIPRRMRPGGDRGTGWEVLSVPTPNPRNGSTPARHRRRAPRSWPAKRSAPRGASPGGPPGPLSQKKQNREGRSLTAYMHRGNLARGR